MYWLVCYIMCLLFFLGDLQICSISRRLLLGTFIAPTWGSVSTGDFFFSPWSVSCCLQWKWHSDACLSPTALAALAWFKNAYSKEREKLKFNFNQNQSLDFFLFFSFFFFLFLFWKPVVSASITHMKLWRAAPWKEITWWTQSLKKGIYTEHSSDFYTMIRLSEQRPHTTTTTKKKKKVHF